MSAENDSVDMQGYFKIKTTDGDILADTLTIEGVDDWWKANENEWEGDRVVGQTIIVRRLALGIQ